MDKTRLNSAFTTVRDALLAERNSDGVWEGQLSTSALSTATAVVALQMMQENAKSPPDDLPRLIDGGLQWLASNQNDDGGWGDTVKSFSNISTSMLAHAAFHKCGQVNNFADVVASAQAYIDRIGGVDAVLKRYGKDRTFSIPILTHCALAGLVDWKDVISLPFELACLPHRFYKTVRLPVVSYALPALIAIGQVKYHFRKPWNPVARVVRHFARRKSLDVLTGLQPENGGFLEATPLTSFVTMSLAGIGQAQHRVAQLGMQFIRQSVLEDGSWPIDTNLSTWVSTLAINALGDSLPETDRPPLKSFLLNQQFKTIHPFTKAAPGGWSWTNLPGGVPDADDTPGAILALKNLTAENTKDTKVDAAIQNGIDWLLSLQNRNGGFPTFCRGWGKLPFDRSSPDISAHCLRAIAADAANNHASERQKAAQRGFQAGMNFLKNAQNPDGSWFPLWFGNQYNADEENPTYGTARCLMAYRDVDQLETSEAQRGLQWLAENQNADGGWGGKSGTPSTIEETSLAVEALLSTNDYNENSDRGIEWLVARVESGDFAEPSPIGFYFAKLWYFEKLYPLAFLCSALNRAVSKFS